MKPPANAPIRAAVVCLALLSLSCARLNYRADHKAAVASAEIQEHRGDIFFDEATARVELIEALDTEGFHFDPASTKLVAAPGSGNVVLQRVQISFPTMENFARLFWFGDYRPEQRWRKGLCYWQVPIMWLTLGVWHIVPIYYPCVPGFWHTGAMREIAGKRKRNEILADALRAEACRLGGDAVVGAKVQNTGATGWVVQREGHGRCEIEQEDGNRRPRYRARWVDATSTAPVAAGAREDW